MEWPRGCPVREIASWAQEEGLGKKFKFDVYEPGWPDLHWVIEDIKHLRRILGKFGKDLEREVEMILFLAKFECGLSTTRSLDGEVNDADAPPYRIEFETVQVYTEDKVTPINEGAEGTWRRTRTSS